MLIIFYAGNFDSPSSKFMDEESPNNFYLLYKKNGKKGFRFLIHDAEHSLLTDEVNPGIGIEENRVNIGNKLICDDVDKFHPHCLHEALSENLEYKMQFAQHIYKYMFGNGIMTPEKAIELFRVRAREIQKAIIAESARWGDAFSSAKTKEDWKEAVGQVTNDYLPYRNNIVIQQLIDEGLYPEIDPTVFVNNGNEILDDVVSDYSGYSLVFNNPNTTGDIYYTSDGTDPRLVGGSISGEAINIANNSSLTVNTSMIIKSRVKEGSTWSAMNELVFVIFDDFTDLKITEIHYHPLDYDTTLGAKQLEFIELKNTGSSSIDLSGLEFSEGIDFTFPTNTFIEPDSFIVVASNDFAFFLRYGFNPFGVYDGSLNNGGEDILLSYYGYDTVIYIDYFDTIPWPVTPDGTGPSMVPVDINPVGEQNNYSEWRPSYFTHGSPGKDDLLNTTADMDNNKVLSFKFYPVPVKSVLNIHCSKLPEDPLKVEVCDLTGKQYYTDYLYEKALQINMQHFSPGVYFVKLTNNLVTTTKKIVVY